MARQLKRWESPRKEGRNDKGKGGTARQRQLRKQTQALRRKLREEGRSNDNQNQSKGKGIKSLPFFVEIAAPIAEVLLFDRLPNDSRQFHQP